MYAARDIEKHTMVIEYIGTIIRNEVANRKEKLYESQVRAGVCSPFLSPFPFYRCIPRQMLTVCRMNLWIMKRREPWLQQAIGVRSPQFCVLLCSKCSRLKVQPQEASFLLKDLRVLKCLINLAAPQPGR